MPNRRKSYKDKKKYAETRYEQNKRYYAKTSTFTRMPWDSYQDKLVLDHKMTDTEISHITGHSVKAVQMRRHRLTHKKIK